MQKKRSTHPLTDREDAPLAGRAFQTQNAESGFGIGKPNGGSRLLLDKLSREFPLQDSEEPGIFMPGNKGGTAFQNRRPLMSSGLSKGFFIS